MPRSFPVTIELGDSRYTIQDYPWDGWTSTDGKRYPDYETLRDHVVVAASELIEGLGERVKEIDTHGGNPLQMLASLKAATSDDPKDPRPDVQALQPMGLLKSVFAFNPAAMVGGAMYAGGKGVKELVVYFGSAQINGVRIRDALLFGVTRYPKGETKGRNLREQGAMEWAFKGNDGEYFALMLAVISLYFGGILQVPFDGVAALWKSSTEDSNPSATTARNST